jgi:predicted chitinase
MAVKFDIKDALSEFKRSGGTTYFSDSLKDVLRYIQNDKNINSVEQAAYLLATAKVESDYSLQRWEADYVCGRQGVPYKDKPCQKAINYYRSSNGKKNYFELGVDGNGMAYFGRGLIQLTGKGNYEKYGGLIGVDLAKDGDKALIPKNSYKIASEYLKARTWKHVDSGDLTRARKSVNGGTKGIDAVNKEYNRWIGILKKKAANFKVVKKTKKERIKSIVGYSLVGATFIGFAYALYYFTRPKNS